MFSFISKASLLNKSLRNVLQHNYKDIRLGKKERQNLPCLDLKNNEVNFLY